MVTKTKPDAKAYLRQLFGRTRNGRLTLLGKNGSYGRTYCLDWDEGSLEDLLRELDTLCRDLRSAAESGEPKAVFDRYLAPFPPSGLDEAALDQLWIKEDLAEPLTAEEQQLKEAYIAWYRRQALTRLPAERTEPCGLINHGRRYGQLIRLGAPEALLEAQARSLGWELAKYRFLGKKDP